MQNRKTNHTKAFFCFKPLYQFSRKIYIASNKRSQLHNHLVCYRDGYSQEQKLILEQFYFNIALKVMQAWRGLLLVVPIWILFIAKLLVKEKKWLKHRFYSIQICTLLNTLLHFYSITDQKRIWLMWNPNFLCATSHFFFYFKILNVGRQLVIISKIVFEMRFKQSVCITNKGLVGFR